MFILCVHLIVKLTYFYLNHLQKIKLTFSFSVPPQRPRIEYNASQVLPGHNLTALHGEVAVIKCISHYGNPPPVLKWFLGKIFLLQRNFKKFQIQSFIL